MNSSIGLSEVIEDTPRTRSVAAPFLPSRHDPRIPFACLLTIYAAMGCTLLGFNRNPVQMLLTVAAGCGLEMGLHRVLGQLSCGLLPDQLQQGLVTFMARRSAA